MLLCATLCIKRIILAPSTGSKKRKILSTRFSRKRVALVRTLDSQLLSTCNTVPVSYFIHICVFGSPNNRRISARAGKVAPRVCASFAWASRKGVCGPNARISHLSLSTRLALRKFDALSRSLTICQGLCRHLTADITFYITPFILFYQLGMEF